MRGIWRFIAGLVLILAILAGAAWLLRAPLAGATIRWALVSAGVQNPSLSVDEIALDRLTLKDVAAGVDRRDPDIAIASVDATFNWLTLLRARRVDNVVVGEGSLTLRISEDGRASLAGMELKKSEKGGATAGFPFSSLTLNDLALAVRAPKGAARGRISGGFEPEAGGAFSVSFETALLAANDFRAENAHFNGHADLRPDGVVRLVGDLEGDFAAPQATARNVKLSLDGDGASWRDALAGGGDAISGRATIAFASSELAVADSPLLGWLRLWRAPEQEAIRTISLTGGLEVGLADGRLSVAAVGGETLQAMTDRGDTLAFAPLGTSPFYDLTREAERVAASARLSGPANAGEGSLTAEHRPGEDWRFEASVAFDEQRLPAISFGAGKMSATGGLAGGVIDADAVVSTLVKSAKIGRLNISDTALGSTLRIRIDLAAKELQASNYEAACLDIKRTRVTFEGQDSEMRLDDAEFCRPDGPLVVARWSEEPGIDFVGTLTARDSRLRFVRTRFVGPPPAVDFTVVYLSRPQLTEITGTFAGGRVVLNDALVGSGVDGRFTFTLDRDVMSGEAFLDRVRVTQNRRLLFVAPLMATGTARLADQRIAFDYAASTMRGLPLGTGEGEHDIRSGRGATDFHSGDLEFAPDGLQPASLILALAGIVSDAKGAVSGDVRAEWGPKPEDFKTSGGFVLGDVSFIGPGRAISKTGGVSGELKLTNLFPLKSDGPQSLEIRLLDLDSLIMENGVATFELPGNDTLHIINAEFPWYGGRIGAYDTVADFGSGKTTTEMKAENVDFGALLALADVDGLSGEGRLTGTLPIVFEEGRARIVDGRFKSVGPGVLRYVGKAAESAASAGSQAKIAFSILRDLRFRELTVTVNGYLDGRIQFVCEFVGTGEVEADEIASGVAGRVPVKYKITLDAALLELLKQARLSRDIKLQIEQGRPPAQEIVSESPSPSQ